MTSSFTSSSARECSLSDAVTAIEARLRGVRAFDGPGDGSGEAVLSGSLPLREDSAFPGELGAEMRLGLEVVRSIGNAKMTSECWEVGVDMLSEDEYVWEMGCA